MKPFLTVVTICSIVVAVIAPPAFKLIAIFFLFCIPGFVIATFALPQKDFVDQVILSILTGFAFQIVYAYILSLAFHFSLVSLSLPGLCLSILFDFKGTWNPKITKKAFLIFIPALLFGVLALNLVPGEDANFHILALNEIVTAGKVPSTYRLYPEIPQVMYPLGFHILTAQLQIFSGVDNLIFNCASIVSALLCLSVYWCTKKLFSFEVGLLAGVLSVFATLPPFHSIILSTYANLMAYIFTCAAIGVIADFDKTMNWKPLLLLSLILAAGIETHLSFFLIVILVFMFLVTVLVKNGSYKNVKYVIIPLFSLVLSIPFLIRISPGYSQYEIGQFLSLWYDPLQLTPQMIPHQVGIWITLISMPGFFLLEKHRVLFLSWIGVFLFLALNTIIRIQFPLWYVFFATRMVDQLFLPFSILAAFFIVKIWKFSRIGVVLLCGILLFTGSSPLMQAPRADRGDLFPTISHFFAADQKGMVYLLTADEDAVILNEWWTATGSAWIPSLANRRVVFPYIFSLEHYMDVLNIPEKEQKSFVIAAFPDSEEAHKYLKEWGVDYIFLSSYVLEEAKWRNNLWNPFVLIESPNYDLVFQEEHTYIFKVNPRFEYSNTFGLNAFGFITVTPDNPVTLDVSLNPVSFSVDTILDMYIEESEWGEIKIETEESILAVIPLTETGYNVHVAMRIPADVNEVTISVSNQSVRLLTSVSTAFRDSFRYSYNVALVGEWEKARKGYELKDQGHIYLFNISGTIELTYIDTGEGNVDFNMFIDGKWEKLTTIYRENDGEKKTILLEIPEGYTLLDIGINNWGDPFVFIGLN